MTDNEIIKFIEHAINSAKGEDGFKEIYWEKLDYILNLINRQKAEIERLKCEMGKLLPKDCSYAMQMEVSNKLESQIKSEAIIEFWERLKEEIRCEDDCGYHCHECHFECKDYVISGDNLVKEMMEGGD